MWLYLDAQKELLNLSETCAVVKIITDRRIFKVLAEDSIRDTDGSFRTWPLGDAQSPEEAIALVDLIASSISANTVLLKVPGSIAPPSDEDEDEDEELKPVDVADTTAETSKSE